MKEEILNLIREMKRCFVEIGRGGYSEIYLSKNSADKKYQMRKLKRRYKNCTACHLSRTRNNFVFGEGNIDSKLVFIGEAPGFDEDKLGRPFIGRAGQLLNRLIEAIGLKREDVYITNVVKCHPMRDPSKPDKRGNDRPPYAYEIETCFPILKEQLEILSPKIICVLGNIALNAFLKDVSKITKIHGKIFKYEGKILFPTFHPAAALRKADILEEMKRDFLHLRKLIDEVR